MTFIFIVNLYMYAVDGKQNLKIILRMFNIFSIGNNNILISIENWIGLFALNK
jgi:hypothetical protein